MSACSNECAVVYYFLFNCMVKNNRKKKKKQEQTKRIEITTFANTNQQASLQARPVLFWLLEADRE